MAVLLIDTEIIDTDDNVHQLNNNNKMDLNHAKQICYIRLDNCQLSNYVHICYIKKIVYEI